MPKKRGRAPGSSQSVDTAARSLPENWREVAAQLIQDEAAAGGLQPPDERHAFLRGAATLMYREHDRLAEIASGLGFHKPNALGLVPTTDLSVGADISRALYLIRFGARMIEGISLSPEYDDRDRKNLRRAFETCLGGSKSRYFIQAFSAAQQTVCMANYIGWDQSVGGKARALWAFRSYFSEVCGALLAEVPTDEFVLRRTKLRLSEGGTTDQLCEVVRAASVKLAIDTLWEVLEDPRSQNDQAFWFPIERPSTRRALGKVLRDHLRTR